jgi:hypothetical protein
VGGFPQVEEIISYSWNKTYYRRQSFSSFYGKRISKEDQALFLSLEQEKSRRPSSISLYGTRKVKKTELFLYMEQE